MLVPFEGRDGFDPGDNHGFIRFSPNGQRVVVAAKGDNWAAVVDRQSGKQVRRFSGLRRLCSAILLTNDRLLLSDDEAVTVHRLASGGPVVWAGEEGIGRKVWAGPDSNRIVTYRGGLHLYDLKKRAFGRVFAPLLPAQLTCVRFSPDGRFLAVDAYFPSERRFIQVWDVRRKPLLRLLEVQTGDGDLGGMAFSPDNRLLAVSVESGATLFDLEKGERVGDHDPGLSITSTIRFSPSGRSLEMIDFHGNMARIRPTTGRVLQRLSPPEGHEVGACAVDGRNVATGVAGNAVLFWRLPAWLEH